MSCKKLTYLVLSLFLSTTTFAGNFEASQLTGSWKISDVKITGEKASTVDAQNCYLCDLYLHDRRLEFTSDGHVQYEDHANPTEVLFKVDGDKLVFYREEQAEIMTPEKTELQNKTVTTSVEFKATLANNVLTIRRDYPGYTETYTLTK